MIPFLDLKPAYDELRDELDAAVREAAASGWYIGGAFCDAFEREFAAYVNARHCVGCGNGLDALELCLRALDIGPGDEVIVPSNTYIATWLAVSAVGATIVPVEPDPLDHCLDPDRVEAAITPRTRVLLPVHLYGHPAAMPALRDIADRRGLRIVEDAAQAHGAAIDGVRIGTSSDLVAWSFYPGKNLGALGDAGAVTTDDPDLARRIRTLANYGSAEKYVNLEKGVNSRLDPIQAAALSVKLRHLDGWNARRADIAALYQQRLAQTPLVTPRAKDGASHVWHVFVVQSAERDLLQARLKSAGVGTLVHYPIPPFRQRAYLEFGGRAAEFPIADRLAQQVLSLPMGPHLGLDDARLVADAVIDACRDD